MLELYAHNQAAYEAAQDYLQKNPGYELSQSTVIGDFWVGKWLVQQLRALEKGTLSPYQTEKMQELAVRFTLTTQTKAQRKWLQQFEEAKALFEQHGACGNWPEAPDAKKMLRWIQVQRKKLETDQLRQNEVALLASIGVTPEKKADPWMKNFHLAEEYRRTHGDLNVPTAYITESGVRLGTWICKQRSLYRGTAGGRELTELQVRLLEELGMEWNPYRKAYETGLEAARRYYEANGNLNVPTKYVDDLGFPLFQWLADIRKKKSKLPDEDIRYLESMHFTWTGKDRNR